MQGSRIQLWVAVVGVSCLLLQAASATPLFQEGFNYTAGSTLHGNDGWTLGNANLSITNDPLTYDSLADTTPSGLALSVAAVGASSTVANFNAGSITSGTIYYSFLLSPELLPTANNYLTSLLPSGSTGPGGSADPLGLYVGAGTISGTYKIGARHNGSGANYVNTAAMTLGSTNFVVVAYTFNPSTSDDSVSLWFDPTPGGSMPSADETMSGGTDAANLQVVGFKAQSATSGAGNWVFDTLRIGTTWADVTPVIPEPSTVALLGVGLGLVAAVIRRRR
jgi:hypothetical protein